MRIICLILLILNISISPILADIVRTDNCLRNLYETQSEIKSISENNVKTKPKHKFLRKHKQEEQPKTEIYVPIENNSFVVFPVQR